LDKPVKPAKPAVFATKMPQSQWHKLGGHGVIRGGSSELGFAATPLQPLSPEFPPQTFKNKQKSGLRRDGAGHFLSKRNRNHLLSLS